MPKGELPLRARLRGAAARALGRLPSALQLRISGRPPYRIDGETLDPTLQLLLSARRGDPRTPLTAGSPAEARSRHRQEILALRGRPTAVGGVRDLMLDVPDGELRARHYMPPGSSGRERPLLVYYHGGGFLLGDLDTHDEACRLLCLYGDQQVLSVEYRLAPEHPFPAPVEDATNAFRWAQEHAARLGSHERAVSVAGDSAGGTLAAVVAQRTARDRPPLGQLLIYPATDRSTRRRSAELFDGYFLSVADRDAFSDYYFGATPATEENPGISPLLSADLSGLSPALVVTSGFDVLRDEGEAYAELLRAAGTPCLLHREASLAHGFVQLTGVSRASRRATIGMAERWRSLLHPLLPT